MQPKYKKSMHFLSTLERMQGHSTNMPLVARYKRFSEIKYLKRQYNVDSFDEQFLEFKAAGEAQDKGNSKTQMTVPKQIKEKIMVSEILYLVHSFAEMPGQKMGINTFWKLLKDITTSLEVKKQR
jgi:hypothetical protein